MAPEDSAFEYDVMIVGAGPAGLSAALVLGRCRERVLVLDDGLPRNGGSRSSHGFFTRDGAPPEFLRQEALRQLAPYDVRIEHVHVSAVRTVAGGFELSCDHQKRRGRKLLIATGMRESDAQISGVSDHIGAGVFCCPYCDGWEVRDRSLGALATDSGAAEYALGLLTWSAQVTLFTNGIASLSAEDRARLARYSVRLIEQRIDRVLGGDGARLRGVQLADETVIEVDALFLHAGQYQHSVLAQSVGCVLKADTIETKGHQLTNVPGLYVAGDAAAHVNSIAIAVADGYKAALAMHAELRRERTP
jgi:thioredoxin reductase